MNLDTFINIETTTNVPVAVVDATTGYDTPVNETPTTIGEIVMDTTTPAEVVPVATETPTVIDGQTTTGAPVDNALPSTDNTQTSPPGTENLPTNVETPGADTTVNTDSPPLGTETGTTTNIPEPVMETTTGMNEPPIDTTTNTPIPGTEIDTVNVSEPAIDTTTNVPAPVLETTSGNVPEPVIDTTTDLPPSGPETTTAANVGEPIVNTTTDTPPLNTETPSNPVEAPIPETTTDNKVDTPSTTIPANDAPKTTEKVSEPTDKPSDEDLPPAVTVPPQQQTAVASQAQATASEYKSQVDAIIPIIVAWTNNPDGLKTDTLDKVGNLINGVNDAITSLGGSTSSGCNGKRKRGLLDFVSGVINTLSCVASNLEDISSKVTGGIVTGVEPIVGTLTNNSQDLKEQSEETEEEEEDEDEESKTVESKTEASTTEKPTSTEAETTATTETTATSGACSMRESTNIPAASDTAPRTSIPLPPPEGEASATETSAAADASETATTDSPSKTETAEGSESTTVKDTSAQETTTGGPDETTTADETTSMDETKAETSTFFTLTPSTLLTTTRPSSDEVSNTITASTELTTSAEGTTTAPTRTYYPCVPFGGPRVENPYCQCETTLSGKHYVATTSMVDGACDAYTEFPSKINPTTEAPPPTDPAINEPLTQTNDGTVLAWSSYKLEYNRVYKDVTVTYSHGLGEARTIETPVPTQTAVDNDGSGQCGTSDKLSKQGLGDACDGAIAHFEDDVIYKGYTTRYDRSRKGILMVASAGQAGCIAKFSCDDYGIGMSGKLIKEA